jgi:ribonuclease Z
VDRLILTHVSARYADNSGPLQEEAEGAFEQAMVAHDGMTLELGYRSDPQGEPDAG